MNPQRQNPVSVSSLDFPTAFYDKAADLDWHVAGLITPAEMVYGLGSDSKLIGRIFELVASAALLEIAEENGLTLAASPAQTVYPDFTMFDPAVANAKLAIDIKSTYRRFKVSGEVKPFGFTLGAYGSFLRNGTKNIAYPYSEYVKHYVIGFVYTRSSVIQEGEVFDVADLDQIHVPYSDVEYFVQEKHCISGDRPGSGNTENIGTFLSSDIEDFKAGRGPFSRLGEAVFEDYWRNFPRYRSTTRAYSNLAEYQDWVRSGRP